MLSSIALKYLADLPNSDDEIGFEAQRLAEYFQKQLCQADIEAALSEAVYSFGWPVHALEKREFYAPRLADAKYWKRWLKTQQIRYSEHQEIIGKKVHRSEGVFISQRNFARMAYRQKREAEAVAKAVMVNELGEKIQLEQVVKKSTANPELRLVELIVRARGLQAWAEEKGLQGWFITRTCPTEYHPMTTAGGKVQPNPNYKGYTPKEAQAYLVAIAQEWRKAMDKRGIKLMAVRVVEPHHDGTPHWHMCAFCKPEESATVLELLRRETFRGETIGEADQKYRLDIKRIDERGAVGYLLKYISKNINGSHVDDCLESGLSGQKSAARAMAYSRLWGFRQFDYWKMPSVGVWHQLRKAGRLDRKKLQELLQDENADIAAAARDLLEAQGTLLEPVRNGLKYRMFQAGQSVKIALHGGGMDDLANLAKVRKEILAEQAKAAALEKIRLAGTASHMGAAHMAADMGNFYGFMQAMHQTKMKVKHLKTRSKITYKTDFKAVILEKLEARNQYNEPTKKAVGVVDTKTAQAIKTKVHTWSIDWGSKQERAKVLALSKRSAQPWTRGNNYPHAEKIGGAGSEEIELRPQMFLQSHLNAMRDWIKEQKAVHKRIVRTWSDKTWRDHWEKTGFKP